MSKGVESGLVSQWIRQGHLLFGTPVVSAVDVGANPDRWVDVLECWRQNTQMIN
jgi:hypothetical protein